MCHVLILQLIFFCLFFFFDVRSLFVRTFIQRQCVLACIWKALECAFGSHSDSDSYFVVIFSACWSFYSWFTKYVHGVLMWLFVCMICAYVHMCVFCVLQVYLRSNAGQYLTCNHQVDLMVVFRLQRHWIISILYNLILSSFTMCASVCACVDVCVRV